MGKYQNQYQVVFPVHLQTGLIYLHLCTGLKASMNLLYKAPGISRIQGIPRIFHLHQGVRTQGPLLYKGFFRLIFHQVFCENVQVQ